MCPNQHPWVHKGHGQEHGAHCVGASLAAPEAAQGGEGAWATADALLGQLKGFISRMGWFFPGQGKPDQASALTSTTHPTGPGTARFLRGASRCGTSVVKASATWL